jgi:Tol biopolymer transport system component
VFARNEGKRAAAICVASSTGVVIRRLTGGKSDCGAPQFSPDGLWITYHADRGEHSEIVVTDRWGLEHRVVASGEQLRNPRWSPDGRWIVYTAANPAGPKGNFDVMAVPVDGGSPVVLAGGPAREADPCWRPMR